MVPDQDLRIDMRSDTIAWLPLRSHTIAPGAGKLTAPGSGPAHPVPLQLPPSASSAQAAGQLHSSELDLRIPRIELRYDAEATSTSLGSPESTNIPAALELAPNHPNPFNPETTIRFGLPQDTRVHLDVLDLLGRRVLELENGSTLYKAGWHSVRVRAGSLPSRVYFYRIRALGQQQVRSFTLLP